MPEARVHSRESPTRPFRQNRQAIYPAARARMDCGRRKPQATARQNSRCGTLTAASPASPMFARLGIARRDRSNIGRGVPLRLHLYLLFCIVCFTLVQYMSGITTFPSASKHFRESPETPSTQFRCTGMKIGITKQKADQKRQNKVYRNNFMSFRLQG